jgi:RNA polymerase sigma-70 factor, ECF subfamily
LNSDWDANAADFARVTFSCNLATINSVTLLREAGVSEPSDRELVSLSRQGNKAAFGQLVLRYQPMALGLATRVVGNRDMAQEFVQEAMLQAYLSLANLHDPTRFKNWLYGIVLNLCRNDLRQRKLVWFSLEAMRGDLVDAPMAIADRSLDPQLVAEQAEIHHAVFDAVDELSPKNRSAILLFYHEQFTLQEVADRLNISVNAVKGRLHKSRHQLRLQLVQLQDSPTLIQEIPTMTTHISEPIGAKTAESELDRTYCCSFCGKARDQVDVLIAGPSTATGVMIYICNACVTICNKIITAEIPPLTQAEVEKLMDSGPLSDG